MFKRTKQFITYPLNKKLLSEYALLRVINKNYTWGTQWTTYYCNCVNDTFKNRVCLFEVRKCQILHKVGGQTSCQEKIVNKHVLEKVDNRYAWHLYCINCWTKLCKCALKLFVILMIRILSFTNIFHIFIVFEEWLKANNYYISL